MICIFFGLLIPVQNFSMWQEMKDRLELQRIKKGLDNFADRLSKNLDTLEYGPRDRVDENGLETREEQSTQESSHVVVHVPVELDSEPIEMDDYFEPTEMDDLATFMWGFVRTVCCMYETVVCGIRNNHQIMPRNISSLERLADKQSPEKRRITLQLAQNPKPSTEKRRTPTPYLHMNQDAIGPNEQLAHDQFDVLNLLPSNASRDTVSTQEAEGICSQTFVRVKSLDLENQDDWVVIPENDLNNQN